MKRFFTVLLVSALFITVYSQKRIYHLPEIPGYVILKGDFHSHTVFSDGNVWPTFRIDEAFRDGLDAIAITDHIEYQPKKDWIPSDYNAAWKIAEKRAAERNIILVKAAEITRAMPPGHLNVLFIKDASLIVKDSVMDSFAEAINQGAFIQWNHPGWKSQMPDGIPKMFPIHKELLKRGWLHGIEFFNETDYYPLVLDWCKEYNLAVMSNSDVHDIISEFFTPDLVSHRPMTLIFAKERSEESMKKAMFEANTVAWFGDNLAGPEKLVRELFVRSVSVSKPFLTNDKFTFIEVTNTSEIPFTLVNGPAGAPETIILKGNTITRVQLQKGTVLPLSYDVSNIMTGSNSVLKIQLK